MNNNNEKSTHPLTGDIPKLNLKPISDLEESVVDLLKESSDEGTLINDDDRINIEELKEQIDITNPDHVLLYGAEPQGKIASFSDKALETIQTKDTGEIGELLSQLVVKLKGFDISPKEFKGFKKIFRKPADQMTLIKTQYSSVSDNVETIAGNLEAFQIQLLKDVSLMEHLYNMNTSYFKELTMYIIAGEEKLESIKNTKLKELKEKASRSDDAINAQRVNDLANACDRFEKKLHDLKLTRQISLQMAPQIRLLQNNDSILIERIQSTLSNTLPLWKNQMVIALGLHHSQSALKAQSSVSNMTNELLKKNMAALKSGTIETAKEAERGVVDIGTLVQTNNDLIDTIDEVLRIQEEGYKQRMDAEASLLDMEKTLKAKLLSFKEE